MTLFKTMPCVRVLNHSNMSHSLQHHGSSPSGSSGHGILQARTMEWVARPASRGSSRPRDQTYVSHISCIAGRLFTVEPPGKPQQYPGKVPKGGRNVSKFLGLSDFP